MLCSILFYSIILAIIRIQRQTVWFGSSLEPLNLFLSQNLGYTHFLNPTTQQCFDLDIFCCLTSLFTQSSKKTQNVTDSGLDVRFISSEAIIKHRCSSKIFYQEKKRKMIPSNPKVSKCRSKCDDEMSGVNSTFETCSMFLIFTLCGA